MLQLTTRINTMLNAIRTCMIFLVPILLSYFVYEHLQVEATQAMVHEIRMKIDTMDAHGLKYLSERARRDHFEAGCHFKKEH